MDMKNVKSADIAKALNINRSSVSLWLNGTTNARQDKIYSIAKFLNIDPSWLLGANVPFNTFEDSMKHVSPDKLHERMENKFSQLTDENKKIVLGYIDGMLDNQNK